MPKLEVLVWWVGTEGGRPEEEAIEVAFPPPPMLGTSSGTTQAVGEEDEAYVGTKKKLFFLLRNIFV